MRRLIPLAILMLGFAATAFAQNDAPDAEGCTDSTLLTRMAGWRIEECEAKDFDSRQQNRRVELKKAP